MAKNANSKQLIRRPSGAATFNDQARLLEWLAKQPPQCSKQMQDWLGISKGAMNRRIRRLHAKRLVRIAEWLRAPAGSPGRFTACYAVNPEGLPDRPRPALRTTHGNPEARAEYEEQRSKRRKIERALVKHKHIAMQHGPFAAQLLATRK